MSRKHDLATLTSLSQRVLHEALLWLAAFGKPIAFAMAAITLVTAIHIAAGAP